MNEIASRDEYDEECIRRVEACLSDMGWTSRDIAERVYKDLGFGSTKAVDQYFARRKSSAFALIKMAEVLGINPSYFLCVTDDINKGLDRDGLYALRREIQRLTA